MLAEANKVKELKLEYGVKDKFLEFEMAEDWTEDVFFYYDLSNFFGNYRNYVESRENVLVGTALMQYKCKGEGASAMTLADAKAIRISESNFQADMGKHLNDTNDINPGEEQELYPCGLVALSMFADEYILEKVNGEQKVEVPLDFKELAWKSDMDHFAFYLEDKGENTLIDGSGGESDGKNSWLQGDLLKQRFAIWYRTSASANVRHLWAKIPGGLPSGKYRVTLSVNGPVWDDWKVKKSIVFSTVSSIGGRNNFIGLICIIWGSVLLLSGLVWLIAPSPAKQVVPADED